MVSQQFARGLSQPNPLPLLYPRGIPPSQEFLRFSVWFSSTFWRTSENPCDMQFCQVFAQKRWFRPRRRTGVVFSTDGPNLGLFMWGPHGGGSPGAQWPSRWDRVPRAVRGPFFVVFRPFLPFFARFLSALGLDRPARFHPRLGPGVARYPFPPGFSPPVARSRPAPRRFRLMRHVHHVFGPMPSYPTPMNRFHRLMRHVHHAS